MLRILESQAPAKQTATDTINTLSSRLSSATLLEDRRAAILGLRSFAKQYPASVASGALRDLLAALRRDGDDSDTTKVVLETLLMLFEPDEKSPEASEEITLWLADEFTQRQDNITALLDLLETGEFYLRLYSLQILSHVCAARPQRSHEAVLAAPLGVSRITAVLDERREAVRNEALLLLVALTPASAELQKVVAFENAFDKVFAIIESEEGLTHGSTTVQDCLSLLANLLTLNTSNQSYFRELGCIGQVAKLLAQVLDEERSPEGVSEYVRPQRDMNVWGLLGVVQLFLVQGSQGTAQSQTAFVQNRVLLQALQIAFHQSFGANVRSKSLDTCGDMIRGNAGLQEYFGDLAVPLLRSRNNKILTNGHTSPVPDRKPKSGPATPVPVETTNVIEALLELTLEPASLALFDVRLSACNCMKAFIEGHQGIRGHVLRRAIEGHQSGEDEIPNMLTVLMEPTSIRSNSDPYQVWMASVLLMHLLCDNTETKSMALKVSEGNAEEGEEVVTLVQSLTSNVVAGVQHVEDERALIGYLMLLSTWLFEDPDAVNDLLGEGSNIQGLIAAVKVSSATMPLVAGLCSVLLGIVYEFSTKDSPIARATLHNVLNKNLTRELYIDRLTKLRESPFVRDFEVLPTGGNGGLPDVYFDKTFMDLVKDNFSRILRSIDRDPTFEASILSGGVQKGVSRELVDNLRAQVEEQKTLLDKVQEELVYIQQKLGQEELEHRRTRESTTVELDRIKHINQSLQRNNEEEIAQLQQGFARQNEMLARKHEEAIVLLRKEHAAASAADGERYLAEKKYLEQRQSGHERELNRIKDSLLTQHKIELDRLRSETAKAEEELRRQLETARGDIEQIRITFDREHLQSEALKQELQQSHQTLLESKADFETNINRIYSEHENQSKALNMRAKEAEDSAMSCKAQIVEAEERTSSVEAQARKAEDRATASELRAKEVEERYKKMESQVKTAEEKATKAAANIKVDSKAEKQIQELKKELDDLKASASKAKDVQTELDDLLVVFADLEAKREADKKRLKELGEEVSEDEDGDEEGDVDDDEEDAEAGGASEEDID